MRLSLHGFSITVIMAESDGRGKSTMLMRSTEKEMSSRPLDNIGAVGAETEMRGVRIAGGRNTTSALMKRTAL